MQHTFWRVLIVWLVTAGVAQAQDRTVLWRIGQRDQSYRDLAFDGQLTRYDEVFPDDVNFTIGRDDAQRQFSGHHPGARDKWAGRREHPFRIRFDLAEPPEGVYLLTVDLVDANADWSPEYRVRVNEAVAEVTLESGVGDIALLRPEKGWGNLLRYVIGAD